MHNIKNQEYLDIVDNILLNNDFNQMKKIKHHNSNRFDHSLKVSYYSYVIAKRLHLDYEDVARAGLLHDFYLERTVDYRKFKDKVKLYTVKHPQDAIINASKYYDLTIKEKDIIRSHMFPLDFRVPKYMESWVVNMVDSSVSIHEYTLKFGYKFSYVINLYVILLLNSIK